MRRLTYIVLLMALTLVGCKRTPKYVISTGDMAELLADMYTAEAVIDMNHNTYRTDSMKKMLKQSVFERHGVTQEKFDTSMVWYGHNLQTYIDVYDQTIKILEKRNRDMGAAIVQTAVSMSGDSVDVWSGTRYATFNKRLPTRMVSFDLSSDDNWEKGDIYTWRVKLLDNENLSVRWTIVAEYDDNSIDWLQSTSSNSDWNEVVFASDSTLQLKNLKGYFEVTENVYAQTADKSLANRTLYVDSISLIRKRRNEDMYRYRYRLRHYPTFDSQPPSPIKEEERKDDSKDNG